MSEHGFICVGGPLDGQWRAQKPGEMSFHVAQSPDMSRYGRFDTGAMPQDFVVKHLIYALKEHDVHGAAWVLQQ